MEDTRSKDRVEKLKGEEINIQEDRETFMVNL
jgi:hypothetical protein